MKNILVVDDEKDIRELIKNLLAKNNYNVMTASGGKEALDIAKTNHPDLILLDIIMPDMDGRDVLLKLKQDENTKDVPVIILTARGEQFERDYGLQLGACEYIVKPCDSHLILRQIANIFDKSNPSTLS